MGIQLEKSLPSISLLVDSQRFYLKYRREHRKAERSGYACIDRNFFLNRRVARDDILFILGCGSSINNIGPQAWKTIKSNSSIGLNQWICHEHLPDYLMFEGMRREISSDPNLEHYYSKLKLWRDLNVSTYLDKNPKVVVLAKDSLSTVFPQKFFNYIDGVRGFVIPKFNIPGRTNQSKDFSIKVLSEWKLLDRVPFFSRSSVTLAISVGYLLGFENIVLCGVDLNDASFFWDSDQYLGNDLITRPPSTRSILSVHGTVDLTKDAVTVDESIYSINEFFLKPRGIKLTVMSEYSRLFPRLEKFSH